MSTSLYVALKLVLLQIVIAKRFRVYTDLDDTAFASGYGSLKSHLAADVTKIQDRTYAGYESFIFHLSTGGNPAKGGEINVCTARPDMDGFRQPKEVFEDHINAMRGGAKRVLIDKVLYGDLMNIFSYELMGKHKFEQIRDDILRFKAENGEKKIGYIFIGDNGQGDVLTGKLLLEQKIVDYVFIHVVVANEPISTEDGGENMILYRNYDEAAVKAAERGIITRGSKAGIRGDYTKELAKYTKLEKIIEGRFA